MVCVCVSVVVCVSVIDWGGFRRPLGSTAWGFLNTAGVSCVWVLASVYVPVCHWNVGVVCKGVWCVGVWVCVWVYVCGVCVCGVCVWRVCVMCVVCVRVWCVCDV